MNWTRSPTGGPREPQTRRPTSGHLLRLVEAERAWAVDDFRAAVLAFDAAQREAGEVQRPWHRALIIERAARFYLAHGVEHTGYALLADAARAYAAWGAAAKVRQLQQAHPGLTAPDADSTRGRIAGRCTAHRSSIMTGAIDLSASSTPPRR